MPFKKAAIEQGMTAKLVRDTLYVDGKPYTVDRLNDLPDPIKPEKVAMRDVDNHLFFFTKISPFSNHAPSTFKVGKKVYTCNEQFIMESKALLFNDKHTANKIMKAIKPNAMKSLGSQVSGYDEKVWLEKAPDIAMYGLKEKFTQNQDLGEQLISTGTRTLVEAAPNDRRWGIGKHLYDRNIMADPTSWGDNLQGSSLMRVRTIVRNQEQG